MADTKTVNMGEHVDIPKVSSIAGGVKMNSDMGRTLWSSLRSLFVFVLAIVLPLSPLALLILLIRQPDTATNGLTWVWVTMGAITELIAFLTAYGLVHSVLEADR